MKYHNTYKLNMYSIFLNNFELEKLLAKKNLILHEQKYFYFIAIYLIMYLPKY